METKLQNKYRIQLFIDVAANDLKDVQDNMFLQGILDHLNSYSDSIDGEKVACFYDGYTGEIKQKGQDNG